MSTSFQGFPPPGIPFIPDMTSSPTTLYPTSTTTAETSGERDPSTQSSGSFGMVFVVLAIILVVSAVACVLGRFCTKKTNKSNQPKAHKQNHNHKHQHDIHKNNHNGHKNNHNQPKSNHKHGGPPRPKDRDLEFGYRSKEGDIMLGFDPKVKIPSSKVANNNGDFKGDSFGSGRTMGHDGMPRNFP